MKKYLAATAVFLCSASFAFAADTAINLEGAYNCTGTDIDTDKDFKCDMTIKKTDLTYSVTTSCNDGTAYIATGIYDAKKQVFAIVSINPKKAEETGVALADVLDSGAMTANWTYLNKTTLGHTNCKKK
jgi:hypothetical protein